MKYTARVSWTRAGLAARSRAMAWKLGKYMSMDKGPRAVSPPRMSGSFPGRELAIERDQNSVRPETICFMSVPPRIVESRRRVVEPSPMPKVWYASHVPASSRRAVIVVCDSLRADMIRPDTAPTLASLPGKARERGGRVGTDHVGAKAVADHDDGAT